MGIEGKGIEENTILRRELNGMEANRIDVLGSHLARTEKWFREFREPFPETILFVQLEPNKIRICSFVKNFVIIISK